MNPVVAYAAFGLGIAGLFYCDRRERGRQAIALWIPTAWLFFSSSRPLTEWLGLDAMASRAVVYSEGSPIDRAVYFVLEVAALAVVLRRGRKAVLVLRNNWPIVLFFAYAAISISWSSDPFMTLKHWVKGIGDVLMVLIVFTEPDIPDAVRRLVTRLAFVLVPWSLLLIRYFPSLGRAYSVGGTPEPTGVTTQKNSLGGLCTCYGIAVLWRLRSAYADRKDPKRQRRLMALCAVLAMIVWLLHLCDSVTSICTISLSAGLMFLITRSAIRIRPNLIHLLTAGLVACTLYALFFQSSGALIRDMGRNPSLTGRTEIWHEVLSIPNNRWIGVGYESFWVGPRLQEVQSALHVRLNEAHDGYLEIFITLGWIGICLLGALIGTGYRNIIRIYRADPDLGSFRMAWFVAIIIIAITEAAFRMLGLTWIVFLLTTANVRWNAVSNGSARGSRPLSFGTPVQTCTGSAKVTMVGG